MKKMSQQDFDRLQKKKGFKSKRKMGAQKKPELVIEDEVASSGAELSEAPAPALAPVLPPPVDVKPYAAMSASNEARDAQLETIVANNTKVIEDFSAKLAVQQASAPKRVPWEHDLFRDDKTGLLKKIRSTPLEG